MDGPEHLRPCGLNPHALTRRSHPHQGDVVVVDVLQSGVDLEARGVLIGLAEQAQERLRPFLCSAEVRVADSNMRNPEGANVLEFGLTMRSSNIGTEWSRRHNTSNAGGSP